MKKRFGFTLAEVIIVIAVIGVIAALTLPVMMTNYNNRVFATKARRAYSAVTLACSQALADTETKSAEDLNTAGPSGGVVPLSDYFDTVQGNVVTLKDGTTITFGSAPAEGTEGTNTSGQWNAEISIDTNGAVKGPNRDGQDKFTMTLGRNCDLTGGSIQTLEANDWKIRETSGSTENAGG